MKSRGFTLIELLVVSAIVAVLAAITLSSVASLLAKAKGIQCVSNLSQWGMALQLYLKDNDGYLPRRGQGVQPVFQYNRPDDWFNSLTPYLDMPSYWDLYQRGQTPRPHDRSVFICPSANASTTAGSSNFITYGMNIFIGRWDQPDRTKITKLPHTATLAFMADSPGGYASTVPSPYAYSVVPRHGGQANVAFFDGHVQTFSGDYLGCGTNLKTQPDIHWPSGMEGDIWTPY
ncbi:hypothetical protein BH09VER1_BH09VER1_52030 [soil metagenome]